ncbi:universal stress protein [Streptomyces achromogenes]|uniref:universal stress protein n=1 Tax=Streptomyces achromogenes TaxID=67255 RepID=UPI0036FDEE12
MQTKGLGRRAPRPCPYPWYRYPCGAVERCRITTPRRRPGGGGRRQRLPEQCHGPAVGHRAGPRAGADLWPVPAGEPPGGDSAARRRPSAGPPAGEWQRLAEQRPAAVLDEISGAGPGVPMPSVVVRGTPGRALAGIADRENDVLVVGAGRPGLRRAFSRRVSRHCLAHAVCPVLAVPRPRSSRSCRPSTDATRRACASTSASCDRGPARVAPGPGDTVPSTTASQPSGCRQRGTLPAARGSTVFPWSTATTPAPWQPAGTRPAPRPWRTTATGPVRYAVPSATPSRCSACCCVWTGRPAR